MITTEFYNGQGLGNQLWTYVVMRAIAFNKNIPFGIQCPEKFKGADIFDIDYGETVVGGKGPEGGPPCSLPFNITSYLKESQLFEKTTGLDVSGYDERLQNISDRTKFDGNCQSLKYLDGLENHVREWLAVKKCNKSSLESSDDVCVIHVRGGDYLNTMSCLSASYYKNAMDCILKQKPSIKFVAVTDDLEYCNKILPNINVIGSTPSNMGDKHRASHHIGGKVSDDFSIIYNAKYLIISSSTFAFWPAYLNTNSPIVIAPKFWFAFSKSNGWWSTEESIVPLWNYLDRFGELTKGSDCIENQRYAESVPYIKKNYIDFYFLMLKRIGKRIKSKFTF